MLMTIMILGAVVVLGISLVPIWDDRPLATQNADC
jgi:hypothetical protein